MKRNLIILAIILLSFLTIYIGSPWLTFGIMFVLTVYLTFEMYDNSILVLTGINIVILSFMIPWSKKSLPGKAIMEIFTVEETTIDSYDDITSGTISYLVNNNDTIIKSINGTLYERLNDSTMIYNTYCLNKSYSKKLVKTSNGKDIQVSSKRLNESKSIITHEAFKLIVLLNMLLVFIRGLVSDATSKLNRKGFFILILISYLVLLISKSFYNINGIEAMIICIFTSLTLVLLFAKYTKSILYSLVLSYLIFIFDMNLYITMFIHSVLVCVILLINYPLKSIKNETR